MSRGIPRPSGQRRAHHLGLQGFDRPGEKLAVLGVRDEDPEELTGLRIGHL
jgi:hypothetical protein